MRVLKRSGGEEGASAIKKAKSDDGAPTTSTVLEERIHDSLVNALNGLNIDEELHSRQLAVYGKDTMRKIFESNVLVSGLNGLGVEIAKNLVLAGVKSITLHDEHNVELWDLSSNFCLSEDDVGKNRALACVQKLKELNWTVLVSTTSITMSTEQLDAYQVVVFTDISLDKAIEFDDYCHNHQPPISFIKSEVCGLFGSVFCDFGPEFSVVDADDNEHIAFIEDISNDNPAVVSCRDHELLEFQDGDLVVFYNIEGMVELNDGRPRKIKNVCPFSFTVEEDTTNFGGYYYGGTVSQVKLPKILQFKALREAIKDPGEFLRSDFSKFDRPPLLHLAFQALDSFRDSFGRFPVAGSDEDFEKLMEFAVDINEKLGDSHLVEIDRKLLRQFSYGSRAVLNPMAAIFGGIVAQEVIKACTAKFHPLYQFFYFDSLESLPTEPLEAADLKPLNCRYDAQISVLGSKLQKKLEEAKLFIVGSGALGCEFLKNLALMGVCCHAKGNVTITDDDVIEISNLSRQFLFRDWDIGQVKSTVAATAAGSINPNLHIEALQNRASLETENVFNDAFWEGLDVVINALDNVLARKYIDSRCLYFQKPLLESGTLGVKCSTQMVIPHLTENYSASTDPPEKQEPMATLHSFPERIYQYITWAVSEFDGLFQNTPSEVNAFLDNPSDYASSITMRYPGNSQARDLLERVIECLEALDKDICETFEDCVSWAQSKFTEYFNQEKQSQHVKSLGTSSDKIIFVISGSILRAEAYGILVPEWAKNKLAKDKFKTLVDDIELKKGVNIVMDEKVTSVSTASVDDAAVINNLIVKMNAFAGKLSAGFRMKPIAFEKDNDYHMDFITELANMRAGLRLIDDEALKFEIKYMASRIIPAVATSTAMATGFVCLELYKVISGDHKREDYRNTFANLALPLFCIAEPLPPKMMKLQKSEWSAWDRWIIRGDLTRADLLQWLKNQGINNVCTITCDGTLLYGSMFARHREQINKKLVDLVRGVIAKLPPYRRHIDLLVICEDDNGNDVDIPVVSFYFP